MSEPVAIEVATMSTRLEKWAVCGAHCVCCGKAGRVVRKEPSLLSGAGINWSDPLAHHVCLACSGEFSMALHREGRDVYSNRHLALLAAFPEPTT